MNPEDKLISIRSITNVLYSINDKSNMLIDFMSTAKIKDENIIVYDIDTEQYVPEKELKEILLQNMEKLEEYIESIKWFLGDIDK